MGKKRGQTFLYDLALGDPALGDEHGAPGGQLEIPRVQVLVLRFGSE